MQVGPGAGGPGDSCVYVLLFKQMITRRNVEIGVSRSL